LLGFKCNPYDVCVFKRLEKCGSQTTLGIHVDDVICTAKTEVIIDDLNAQLSAKHPGLVQKRGRVQNLLTLCIRTYVHVVINLYIHIIFYHIMKSIHEEYVNSTS
jgi:hypothetical protein